MRHSGGHSAPQRRFVRNLAVATGLMVVCPVASNAAPGIPQTVGATKTKDATGTQITGAGVPITINQTHNVVWDATYYGATGGFWLTPDPLANKADIYLTTGGGHGTKSLMPGTYYISIKLLAMQPGSYSVRFDPTGDGSTVGDPHITTVNGTHYDFQSAGEFVLLRGGPGLEIQARHTPVSSVGSLADPYSGLSTGVSINTAVAVRMGQHRVTLQFDDRNPSVTGRLQLRVDGQNLQLPPDGFKLSADERLSPASDGGVRLDFEDGTRLIVTPGWWATQKRWYLDLDVQNTTANQGLMGVITGRNWLPGLPNGSNLGPKPSALRQRYQQLYGRFADAWRVTPQSSLFDYGPGESTHSFTRRDWPRMRGPFSVPGSIAVPMTPLPIAQRACRGISDLALRRNCVFDVRVMGDPGIAKNYARFQRIPRDKGVKLRDVRIERGMITQH